jgi:hypothetical protein
MGLVKEPKGVDLYVVNRSLSISERQMISDFIKKNKEKQQNNIIRLPKNKTKSF